jgi:hypothetical protein
MGGISVELVDVKNRNDRYISPMLYVDNPLYMTTPEVVSSYFQEYQVEVRGLLELRAIVVLESSLEEKEGFGGIN